MDFSNLRETAHGGPRERSSEHRQRPHSYGDVSDRPAPVLIQVGIDAGQIADPCAIAVTEWDARDDGLHFTARRLERLALGSSYVQASERICELLANLQRLSQANISEGKAGYTVTTVLDVTGVGRGLYDLLTNAGQDIIPMTITSTERLSQRDDGEWSCGKSVLVSNLLIGIQRHAIHLPEGTEAEALLSELESFRLEETPSGKLTFNAKSGAHDDLIVALGLATLPGLRPRPAPVFFGMAVVSSEW